VSNDRLNVKVVSNQNSVELTKNENTVVVSDKKCDTSISVLQKETAVVTVVSKGPKGDKGDKGDMGDIGTIGTTITNQIATGSITASVNIGADTFKVQSGSSTFLYISSSGNVGIGTTSLTNTLQVNGGITATSITGSLFGTASVAVTVQTASFLPIGTYNITSSWAESASNAVNAINAMTASNITPSITNNTDNNILTATGGGTINGETNLTFDGSVLTVTGSLTTTGDITTQNLTVANITASENIRIGRTKSIGGNFVGSYAPFITYHNDGLGFLQSASFGFRGSAYMDSIAYPDIFGFGTNDLRFFASTNGIATPTEIIRVVGSTGFVGIGETSPSAKLEIRGSGATSATTALRVENSSATGLLTILNNGTSAFNTNHLYVSSSGRVGIGTTSPQSQLHITGANALFTLSPIHPLPTTGVASASFATSGSGTNLKPYFWDGATWNALY